jgi:hypothetical protein
VPLPSGVATGIGSLPHTDAAEAAAFVLERLPDLPVVPTLPRRSAAERMLAHATVGLRGVSSSDDGDIAVDADRLDPAADVRVDLEHDAFGGLRAFLDAAAGRTGPVKWQVCGPITLGVALHKRGAPAIVAFEVAVRAIREHIAFVGAAISAALPGCRQVVVIDEPAFPAVLDPAFPLDPGTSIDLLSCALAAIEPEGTSGVHCCGAGDWVAIASTGPAIISVPARPELVDVAGELAAFLDGGGWIAWGAVPTHRPVSGQVDRYWRDLSSLWCSLVQGGCDPLRLRHQALITPDCGLGLHAPDQAARVLELVSELAFRVHGQAVATRLTVGA